MSAIRTCAVAALAGAAACSGAAPAAAASRVWTVRSPQGALAATVRAQHGRAALSVRRAGAVVLTARLGALPAGERPRARRSRRSAAFATPAGKRRRHRLDARLLRLRLGSHRRIDVLAADDGVAYRLAGGRGQGEWRAPAGSRGWLQPFTSNYEAPYERVSLRSARRGAYGFPALLRLRGGTWGLLTESGLRHGAPGAHLRTRGRGTLSVSLAGRARPRGTSAWRIAVVGGLATIVGSDLPLALGRPSQIADTSWIRPGRVAWSWWSDSRSPRDPARQRDYVDFAAANGFEYLLVDEGWRPAWIPGLVAYAAARGVRVLLWTDWHPLRGARERRALLRRWSGWGVAGVKVDFLQSDSGARMAVMDNIARDAARRRLVVDFHGCTIPRGLQRTWPNVLTLEAVRGAEHAKARPLDPAHNVTLAFTRNAIGSMDYTPVTFSAAGRRTSAGHELAEAVVYESGLQHLADSPESYAQWPAALSFMGEVPAAWDDTRLLAGAPDEGVTLARRSGTRWFVGALAAGPARTARVPLRFLTPGRAYRARVLADDGSGGLSVSERVVGSGDTLAVPLAPDGGFATELHAEG